MLAISMRRTSPSILETGIIGLILLALAVAVFGTHVLHGGFYHDDWTLLAMFSPALEPDLGDSIKRGFAEVGYRPLLALYLPLVYAVFDDHMKLHLTWMLGMTACVSWFLYLVLRQLRIEPIHAFMIAALVLLFPSSSAIKLWTTAGNANVAIVLFLLGLLCALRALDAASIRSAALLHVLASVSFALSVFLYEIAAAAVIASVAVYFVVSRNWRHTVARLAIDSIIVGAMAFRVATSTKIDKSEDSVGNLERVSMIARGGTQIVADSIRPLLRTDGLALIALGAVLGGALVVVGVLDRHDPRRRLIVRWLAVALFALIYVAAAYVMYVPAHSYYTPGPGTAGIGNRINAVASLGISVLLYSLICIGGLLVAGRSRRLHATIASVLALVAGTTLAAGYARQMRAEVHTWDAAFASEAAVLESLRRSLPDPGPDSVIFTFGHPTYYAPGIPVFSSTWDLDGAVKWLYQDQSVRGYPVSTGGAQIVCSAQDVSTALPGGEPQPAGRYGSVYFVDVATGRVDRPRESTACNIASRDFKPGPFILVP